MLAAVYPVYIVIYYVHSHIMLEGSSRGEHLYLVNMDHPRKRRGQFELNHRSI
jgi:hypothetical protein